MRSRRCTSRGTPVRMSRRNNRTDQAALFVPIHGEYRHLRRHVALAIEAGIPETRCFLLEDGDSLILNGTGAHRGASVEAGRVILEGVDNGGPDRSRRAASTRA